MQTYEIGPVTVTLERDGSFTPVTLDFKYSVAFDSIVPETEEEAVNYHNSVARATKFLQGINNAFILETSYPETELFVTSRVNNVSIEVPDGCNKIPLIGLLLHHKVNALLDDYQLEEFTLSFNINEPNGEQLKTTLQYNPDTITGTRLESILNHFEAEWLEEMRKDLEELGDGYEDLEEYKNPWWHRNDGQVRDFINMDADSFESIQDDQTPIRILTVDLDDVDIEFIPDDDDPETPDSPDDGYFKV